MSQDSLADAYSPRDPAFAGVAGDSGNRQRPLFMEILGLAPPYNLEDVHKAYKAKAITLHPDRGGSPQDFLKLQDAYSQAQEYVRFSDGRRQWLTSQVEPYLRQQEIVQEVEQRGGKVEIESVDWMQRSFGDFAALADRLRKIRLRDAKDADEFLGFLGSRSKDLRYLISLDLTGSQVTDAGLARLEPLRSLQRLHLSRTAVTADGLEVLDVLPEVEWVNLARTSIGWWGRWRLQRRFPEIDFVTQERDQ